MSEELPLQDNSARLLRAEEKALLSAMLSHQEKIPDVENRIALARVYDMSDGGMGSIKFVGSDENTLGENLAEASYFDDDGVQVIMTG
jgi:hypothetical protein